MTHLWLFFLSIPDRLAAWIDRMCDDFDRNFVHKEDRLREEIEEAQKRLKGKKKHFGGNMKLKTGNPYNEVLDIIKASSGFYYTDYIVRLRIAGDEENVYLDCDGAGSFEWNYDWADVPSEDIELLGFCPFNKAILPQEWHTTPVTDPGWYLLKLRRDGEITYSANKWADICGFQWVYAMQGEIIGWRRIED